MSNEYTAEQWAARKGAGGSLQRQLRERGRYLHVSCEARMVEVTENGVTSVIPYIGPGLTYRKPKAD